MKRLLVCVATAVALLTASPSATAVPPHGVGGHVHHVHTGTGDCILIDAVAFLPQERGLHQGASSSGSDHGPWHGPCH